MFDAIKPNTATDLTPDALEANLEAGYYDQIWGEGRRKHARARIRKAKKVFNRLGFSSENCAAPTSRQELEFLAERHFLSDELVRQFGFKDLAGARNWVRGYAWVLDAAAAHTSPFGMLNGVKKDWALLFEHATGQRGGPTIWNRYDLIPIQALANRCCARGVGPKQLTNEVAEEIYAELGKEAQRAMRRAIAWLAELPNDDNVPQALVPSLNNTELPRPSGASRRVVPPVAIGFQYLMDLYLAQITEGKTKLRFGKWLREVPTGKIGKARVKNIKGALLWLWHGLVVMNLAASNRAFDPTCLADENLVLDLVEACAGGELGPISDTQTRRDRVNVVISFLDWHSPGFSARVPSGFFDSTYIGRKTGEDTENRQMKRNACLNFIHDAELQRRFFLMPKTFFDQAMPTIDCFDQHFRADGNGLSKKQNRALELGILAALAAINTLFPARLITINQFRASGPNPNVRFPEDNRSDYLVLDIPGHIVKNGAYAAGVQLRPNSSVSPREILRWYLDKVHPLVLRFKHKHANLRQPELLFTGLHVDTIRRYWACHVASIGLTVTPHMCRHYTASLLLHNGASMADVAVFLGISEKVAATNYAFVSRAQKIQSMMDVQASIYRGVQL